MKVSQDKINHHIAKKQVGHICRENIYLKEIEFDGVHNAHKGTCSICGEFIGWFKIDPPKQNT